MGRASMRLFFPLMLLVLCSCPQTNTCTSNQDCAAPSATCDTQCGTCIDPCATDDDCAKREPPEVCGPSSCGTGQAACQLPGTGGSGGEGGMAGTGETGGEGGAG